MKKISAIATSLLMAGLTVSSAVAAATNTWPNDFTAGAVVYGTGASADVAPATSISNYLKSKSSSSAFEALETITDEEVVLRGSITADTNIASEITSGTGRTRLANLMKTKISWDDGTGSSDYDVEEKILIGSDMKLITRLDDRNLVEEVALTNEQALSYQLYFKSLFNASAVGTTDADTLYLTILGKEYEIKSMDAAAESSSITVVTSEEYTLSKGESVTVDGKTFTITAMSDNAVQVNGNTVSKTSSGVRIDGVRVAIKTDSLFYNSNTDQGSVTLQIGEEISKTYANGEEYIGEDSKDPLWIWDINLNDGAASYIGVEYNARIEREKAPVAGDTIKYAGESYVFPHNYAEVRFDGLTSIDYEDLVISFQDSADLYAAADGSDTMASNANVIVIEGASTDTITTGGKETDRIYLYYNISEGAIQAYYRDWDNDYTPSGRMRLANASVVNGETAATVTVDDTELKMVINATATNGTGTTFLEVIRGSNMVLKSVIGGDAINNDTAGTFEWLGVAAETADAGSAWFGGADRSTSDYSFMDSYGIKIAEGDTVKNQVEDDRIILSIPRDQVYGIVSVSLVAGEAQQGNMLFTANEKTAWQNKNVVLVGGSCVNSATAAALGLAEGTCGDVWTQATTVGEGKYLIQKVDDAFANGKVALVVAGYEAADTAAAASLLVNNPSDVDFSSGAKIVGSSA